MCDRGHIQTVLTWLHTQLEDGMKVTQANAFLSLVPLNVGPSVESRGFDSSLGAVPIHCLSASALKQDVPHDVTVNTIVVVVDDKPVLT